MEANAGLIAGSHNRNELVVIRPDGEGVRLVPLPAWMPLFYLPFPACLDRFLDLRALNHAPREPYPHWPHLPPLILSRAQLLLPHLFFYFCTRFPCDRDFFFFSAQAAESRQRRHLPNLRRRCRYYVGGGALRGMQ